MTKSRGLSDRLRQICRLVRPAEIAADIGTDHGLVPIKLLSEGICPYVIMTDVRKGPLEKARQNLESAGIGSERYDLRLGSGLSVLRPGEVSTVIIAGMGGELIAELLEAEKEKAASYKRLVLQPRSRAYALRRWLNDNNYYVNHESLAAESARISEIIVAELTPCDSPERFCSETDFIVPPLLADRGDPLLGRFLDIKIRQAGVVLAELRKSSYDVDDKIRYWESRMEELNAKRSVL